MKGFRVSKLGGVALVLMSASLVNTAHAQVTERKSLTLDGAKRVIAAGVTDARAKNAPGAVIAVVDEGGNLMALERLDGTFAAGATISTGKARTAVLFKRPTKVFEDIIRSGRTPMIALPDSLFTPLQGGVPIIVDGQVVGGVGVSGAASAQQDEEIAIAGANALAANSNGAAVLYFDKDQVATGFAKGAVLVDGSNGRNYMVHASHREKAGVAELHTLDADIIYVLEGSATLVTGGKVVEGKTIEPNEIRGSSIEGGETRRITKGDVIVVPAGTPHWFKEVLGPINYYVVKVR